MFVKKDAAVHNVSDEGVTVPTEANRLETRRQKVVEAARILFADQGFHGTGIAQIAATSGIRVGQIYRDFACKEDIVAALAELDLSRLLDEPILARAIAAADRTAVCNWIVDLTVNKATPNEASLMPEILAESARNERINAIMMQCDARIRRSVEAAFRFLVPGAGADRITIATELMMMIMMGVCSRRIALVQGDPVQMERCIRAFIDQQVVGLSATCR